MATATRKPLVQKTRLNSLDATTIAVLADKVRDDVGDFSHWLTADDYKPGYLDPACMEVGEIEACGRNVGYWYHSTGGKDKRLGILRSSDPTLHAAFAKLVSARWVVRASHVFGWEALPAFPYRLLWRILSEYGIPDPDSYIKTGAHRLIKKRNATLSSIMSCGAADEPFVAPTFQLVGSEMVWRGLRIRAEAYEFFRGVVGWENRLTMRERLRLPCRTRLSRGICPHCNGTMIDDSSSLLPAGYNVCRLCKGSRFVDLNDSEF